MPGSPGTLSWNCWSDDEEGVDAVCKELGKATGTRITVILPAGRVVGDTEADPERWTTTRIAPKSARPRLGPWAAPSVPARRSKRN